MDEYGQNRVDPGSEFHTGTYEYGTVDPGKEFSLPRLESEFSKECGKEPESKEKRQRGETIKRIIRYTATAALSLGLLVEATPAAPVEPEPEEVESMVLITCAAVRPEEPDLLYYDWNLTDWTVLGGPSGRIEDVFLYIVDPNGQETEPLESVQAPCNRYGYMPEQNGSDFFSYKLFTGEEAGLRQPDPGWKSYGNLSIMLSAERIEPYCEGSSLKIVVLFETEGVHKKMTSVRQIDLLPPTADVSVSLETIPQGNGISHARMRAVFHPQNGDDHRYIFGEYGDIRLSEDYLNDPVHSTSFALSSPQGMLAIQSFSTRWYDSNHQFLNSGWEMVASRDEEEWPFPAVSVEGRNVLFTYDGLVHSNAEDPAAAYYSLEIHAIDVSTNFHYLIESEQIPITD